MPGLADPEILVIGAGPAGSAVASALALRGHDVLVLERQHFPRFVIGESLLPACLDALDEVGLLEHVAGEGYLRKLGATFFRGEERSEFSFAEQFGESKRGHAWQMARAGFDLQLARGAEANGAQMLFGHGVVEADFEDGPRVRVEGEQGGVLRPRYVVDASGFGRVLPRLLGLDAPSSDPPRSALYAHFECEAQAEGVTAILVHPRGAWAWKIPFSEGRVSVGVVADPALFEGEDEASLRALLAEDPNCAIEGRCLLGPRKQTAWSVAVSRLHGPGYCLVGNATGFLDPIFSSGVSLALCSAARAAPLISRHLQGEAVDFEGAYAEPMLRGTAVFRSYVEAWYDGRLPHIIFRPRPDPGIKRKICSVLAGYVWDEANPFVRHHARKLDQLARLLE